MSGSLSCDDVRALAPELALGLVTGQERAQVLAHLQACPRCRDEVARLAEVHDRLRDLVPPVGPPPGFEQRVLDRLGHAPAAVRRDRRSPGPAGRGRRLVAAAVLAAGLVAALCFARPRHLAPRKPDVEPARS